MKSKVLLFVALVTLVSSLSFTIKKPGAKSEVKQHNKTQKSSLQRGFLSEDRL
jgi:hypothetical protein